MARLGAREYGGGIPRGGGGIICIRQLPTYYWKESGLSHGLSRCFLPSFSLWWLAMLVAGWAACQALIAWCLLFILLIDWLSRFRTAELNFLVLQLGHQ